MHKLNDPQIRNTLRAWAIGRNYRGNPAPVIVPDRPELHEYAARHLGLGSPLVYLEFGVAHGKTLLAMAERCGHPSARFIGFDSFEGLPEPWLHLPQGHFSRHGKPPPSQDSRISFEIGWFQNTLPQFLSGWDPPTDPVLVHYDADLYGSTLFILASLWAKIPEYHFIMDDFTHDDAVALFDFATAFPVSIEFLAQTGRLAGGNPQPNEIFGRMKRIQYQPSTT